MDKELNDLLQDESEDAIFARIQEESLRYFNEVELPRRVAEQKEEEKNKGHSLKESVHFEPQPHGSTKADCGEIASTLNPVTEVFYKAPGEGADGFHLAAGDTYVYPTNYPVRQYQKTIIHSALFHNTLVSLPTGLGKTFIAAVVMYNYYRWFPQGKIVFMAPTRPLVAQQIRACHDIMAIPIKDTIEMTGTMSPTDRIQHWRNKRVFFLTPQVMANDLRTKICPAMAFKCVVIDEAHRATKEYSYCHVIKELENAGTIFRVLALSATPGSNIKAVVEVVQNLRISTLELRGEDSPDVVPYTHAKQVEPVSLSLSKSIIDFREQYLLIFERFAKSLRESRLINCNVQNLTKFQLLKASEKIRSRPPNGMNKTKLGVIMSDFTTCMTLAHGLDLLQTYGLRAFYQYFAACDDEENRKAAFTRLNSDGGFRSLMDRLQQAVSSPMDQFWSHPKHEHLVKILKDHFCQAEKQGTDSRVIIFCQFRVVVSELYELLQRTHPLIKPVMFIGQGVGKDKSGLPQKKQIEVMKGFRQGVSNVLIATCVAEEGLDIGAVDLLVMMECQRSPVRLVQRLGRTGRHRQGRCVVLLTCGREVQKFNEAMATRKSFISMIQNSNLLRSNLIKDEPQMVPPYVMPKMQLIHVNVPERITPAKKRKQVDIRQALISKINDIEESDPEESPFLDPEQLAQVKNELGSLEIKYDSLNCNNSEYLFHRINDPPMQPEEIFSSTFTQQSEYNDWNRVLHQTYLVLHSSDTESLCHLLHKSESMLLNSRADLNSQQIYCSGIFPQEKDLKKNKTKSDIVAKKKKNDKEERHGRDIRECMAQAAEKKRLTQNKQVVEKYEDLNINMEEDNLQAIPALEPEPVIVEVSDTILVETSKEIKEISNEELKESKCLFCNEAAKFPYRSMLTRKTYGNNLLDLNFNTLNKAQSFVHNLTKESINSINIAKVFGADSSCTMNNIRNSLLRLEDAITSTSNKKTNSPLVSVDDIFDNDYNISQSPILDSNLSQNHQTLMQKEEIKGKHSDVRSKDYFNLEDLFNEDEDDLGFQVLVKNTKTSTPVKENYISYDSNNINECEKNITLKVVSLEKQHNGAVQKEVVSVKDKLLLNNSEYISPISKLNSNSDKAVFKLPQMKLNLLPLSNQKAVHGLNEVNNITKPQTPSSPILSGQVLSNVDTDCSPILSGQVARNQDLFLSPVLSGQVRANQNNSISQILSCKVTSTPKLERRVLFKDNPSNKACETDASKLCEPLSSVKKYSEKEMEEIEALNLFSASQLFDDSSEEDKKDDLEQSSMYTISQMVAKVSLLADKFKNTEAVLDRSIMKETKPSTHFESSDEDFIFEQIKLDNFSCQKDGFSTKDDPTIKSYLNNACKTGDIGVNKSLNSNSMDSLAVEKNDIKKDNLLKKSSVSVNTSATNGDRELSVENISHGNEVTFISSRWLTCMKTPLKNNRSISFPTGSTSVIESDSDSDLFENSSHKTETKVRAEKCKPKGKSKKQGPKGDFLELEANVSYTGGVACSSDEESTSGLDELDNSFINDMTELPSTSVNQTDLDIQAKYLQSVKSPMRRPGFKIPTLTDSVWERDVFSQAVPEDENDSYQNDSFCCDATEIPIENEPSELEIAERLLKLRRRKEKVRKRKRHKPDSSSGENGDSSSEILKRIRLLSSSSSNEELDNCAQRTEKRKHPSSSESSPSVVYSKMVRKKRRRVKLINSSDSDSDKTTL